MSQEEILTEQQAEDFTAPEWLINKLQLAADYAAFISGDQAPVSEEFRARAREAMEEKDTLSILRSECARIGFVALSIGDYIIGIATARNLSLTSTLSWFEIADLRRPDHQSAAGFAHLGLEIGLGRLELITHIRIAMAGFNSLVIRPRAGASGRNNLQECVSILNEIEAKYDQSTREELRLIEAEIYAVYQLS